ncbi:MAG: dienelactone hydrolase family protein, partial [Bacillota bacterium]
MDIVEIVNQVPKGFEHTGGLDLVTAEETLESWKAKKKQIEDKWIDYLGKAPYGRLNPKFREHDWEERPDYNGRLVYIQTEPDYFEKSYLLVPKKLQKQNPAMLVLFYDIDTMIGENKGGKQFNNTPARFFALELVKRGYVVLVMRWFYQGVTEGETLQDFYVGVKRMEETYPGFKGLGKTANDSKYGLDYLCCLPYVDNSRIGVMGHSLGGKMGLYSAAFDDRIKASVLSELG